VVICLVQAANDLHIVQLMLLPPHHLLLQYNPEWFTFLVPAYVGCPGRKAIKTDVICQEGISSELLQSLRKSHIAELLW